MAPGHLHAVERLLKGARVVFPIGPRGLRRRPLFSFGPLIAATLFTLSPSQGPSLRTPDLTEADVKAAQAATDAVEVPRAKEAARSAPPPVLPEIPSLQTLPHVLSPGQAMQHAPFVELGALDSRSGESFDSFLVRVAQAMDLFTRRTQHETCGVLLESHRGDGWRVRLTTNRSHVSCVMVQFDEPGFRRMGPDIHSHPRVPGGVQVNVPDLVYNPQFHCGQNIVVFDERFSEKDLDRGEGYLVSRQRLLYQRGRQRPFQQRAQFEPIEEAPALELYAPVPRPTAPSEHAPPPPWEAAWSAADAQGLPATQCPAPAEDPAPLAPRRSHKPNRR